MHQLFQLLQENGHVKRWAWGTTAAVAITVIGGALAAGIIVGAALAAR